MDKKYLPGVHKLMYHIDHINKMKEGEVVAPIHVSVWPTLQCQLNCSYCCCKGENRKFAPSLDIFDFKDMVNVLAKYGTKAIEFSGGGEPLLWRHFEEAVEYAHSKGIKVSLITNGLALYSIPKETIDKISWIRISIPSAMYAMSVLSHLDSREKVSLSYMVTDFNEIKELYEVAKIFDIIIRVALPKPSTKSNEEMIKKMVQDNHHLVFYSDKENGTPNACYMPWIRAAVTWDGIFIPCPSLQLTEEHKGYIPYNFKLCHIRDLEMWLIANRPRDMEYRCSYCNCGKDHNDFLDNYFKNPVSLKTPEERVDDEDFV